MNLRDRLAPEHLSGNTLKADLFFYLNETKNLFSGLNKPYNSNKHDTFTNELINLLVSLIIFPFFKFYFFIKNIGKTLLGVITLPYFLYERQGKEALSWLANNAGLMAIHLFSLFLGLFDSLALVLIRMPAKGFVTLFLSHVATSNPENSAFIHSKEPAAPPNIIRSEALSPAPRTTDNAALNPKADDTFEDTHALKLS